MRHFIIIGFLLAAVTSPGQIYVDSYRFSPATPAGLLLDNYPSTAAAYSFRKLRAAYTGNCMVVRRASNSDTLIVGFVSNYLDTVSLKNFCSGTNCFIQRWYDQTGEGRDATQYSAASQPQVVSLGALIRFNGMPAINIIDNTETAVTQHLIVPVWHTESAVNVWSFAVYGSNGNVLNFSPLMSSSPIDKGFILYNGTGTALSPFRTFAIRAASYGPAAFTVSNNVTYLRVDNANRTNINIWGNGTAGTSAADSNTNFNIPNFYWLGNGDAALIRSNVFVSEIFFYNTDQSSNRTAIQTNVNNFYNIY